MYTRAQKESSSVSTTSPQKKSNGSDGSRSFSVQRQPEINSSQEKEIPSYSRDAADSLITNVMRSMEEGKDSKEMSLEAGVQTKLTVGAVGDKYEQEADQAAAQVMSMSVASDNSPPVQRVEEVDNPVQRWSLAQSITPVVQRRVDEQVQMRSLVQRAFQSGGNEASGDLEGRLNASKGGGSALAPEVRAFMEPRFGTDFSSVRVHTGNDAIQMNRELGAQAFAHGSDVYFGAGKAPGNNELTAHELTHVVQQNSVQTIQRSARFGGDHQLEKIETGTDTRKKGSHDLQVIKLQQALIDMGYLLPKYGVDGKFGKETEAALKKFQHDVKIAETGVFDQPTIAALNAKFDTRQPYIDNATFDPAHPKQGTRNLNAGERKAVNDAMKPPQGVGGKAAIFQDEVGGKKYGDEIRDHLTKLIKFFHKELFEDKEPLRKDPAKNFHDWSVLEGTAAASKDTTDALYESYAKAPEMTHAAGNFVDQWEDEIARNNALSPAEQKQKAKDKVWYLIVSNCEDINANHSAVPSDTKETTILTPIVEAFVDTPTKVQTMLDLDIGWEGAQLEGTVYLQRYKQATDEKNREQLWQLFHTCIHEYIHSLAHSNYQKYAQKFKAKGDDVRYNTLIEGFCDFFTENVRKTVKIDTALRQKVEGPYYDAKATPPTVNPGVYPSIDQAEQVVSIVGIRNAQAAYFRGMVEMIGGKLP
jgi:hypothetical protein